MLSAGLAAGYLTHLWTDLKAFSKQGGALGGACLQHASLVR
jgi:hypothetical protein